MESRSTPSYDQHLRLKGLSKKMLTQKYVQGRRGGGGFNQEKDYSYVEGHLPRLIKPDIPSYQHLIDADSVDS